MIRCRSRRRTTVAVAGAVTALVALSACSVADHSTRPSPVATSFKAPGPTASVDDTGRTEHATGTALPIAPGHLGSAKTYRRLQYTIDRGDTLIGIDSRFQICRGDVAALNSGFDAYDLRPGRTLVLVRIFDQPFTASCA